MGGSLRVGSDRSRPPATNPWLHVSGVDVGHAAADAFATVSEALNIIYEVDPKRLRRIQRDVKYLLVTDAPSSAYLALSRTCLLSRRLVGRRHPVRVALTIVHEATHARIASAGIISRDSLRARIEKRCVAEQVALLMKLRDAGYGGTEAWATYLEERLRRPWWTPDEVLRRKEMMLQEHGAPRWLLRLNALLNRNRPRRPGSD